MEEIQDRTDGIDRGNTSPNADGCWFCHRDGGEMKFSLEFDTFYHDECAEELGLHDTGDPVLAYERGEHRE